MFSQGISLWRRTAVASLLAALFPVTAPGVTNAGYAFDFSDLTDAKIAWRRNLFTETEFRNGVNDAPSRGGAGVSAGAIPGFAGAIGFAAAGDTGYAYKLASILPNVPYRFYGVVKMDDGGAPLIQAAFNSAQSDFCIIAGGNPPPLGGYTVAPLGGDLYSLSFAFTHPSGGSLAIGAVKYASNSARGFKITAYQVTKGAEVQPYQLLTDVSTEFLAAFPYHSLYKDNVGNAAVMAPEDPIGLALDLRFGGLRGPEVSPDVGFDNPASWSFAGTPPGWAVSGGVATVATTSAGNRWINCGNRLTPGKTYEIWIDVLSASGGGITPDVSATPVFATTTGRKHWILTATTATLQIIAQPAFVGSIDSLSVKEVYGNHAIQATPGDRPAVSAKVNLITGASEDITVTGWGSTGGVRTSANVMTFTAAGQALYRGTGQTFQVGASLAVSAELSGSGTVQLCVLNGGGSIIPGSGTVTVTLTATPTRYSAVVANNSAGGNCSIALNSMAAGAVTISKAQIELAAVAGPYQRVNTATDYDTVGFPMGARFNGINTWMQVPMVEMGVTDKVLVTLSVRKESDAAVAILLESSVTAASNTGAYYVSAPESTVSANFSWKASGTTLIAPVTPGVANAAPITRVLACYADIAAPMRSVRVNGGAATENTSDIGTGSFTSYPLYIGRRAGSSFPFPGVVHRLVGRGGAAPTAVVLASQQWANERVKAYA